MEYTTQMNAARKNVITKEMQAVAAYEGMDVEENAIMLRKDKLLYLPINIIPV